MREISAGKAGASSELVTGAGGLEGGSSCSQHGSEGLHTAVCTRRVWSSHALQKQEQLFLVPAWLPPQKTSRYFREASNEIQNTL